MPSLDQMVARKSKAMQRIEQAIENVVGADVPTPNLDVKFYGDLRVKEMLTFERLAEWLETLDIHVSNPSEPTTQTPLEYYTTDGLRWLAEQRGIDVSEAKTKAEIIELIEG